MKTTREIYKRFGKGGGWVNLLFISHVKSLTLPIREKKRGGKKHTFYTADKHLDLYSKKKVSNFKSEDFFSISMEFVTVFPK